MRINESLKRFSLILLLSLGLWAAWPAASYNPRLQLSQPVAIPTAEREAPAERSDRFTIFVDGGSQGLLGYQTAPAIVPIYYSAWQAPPASLPILESLYPILVKDSLYYSPFAGRAPPFRS